jgi:hypothetical protein
MKKKNEKEFMNMKKVEAIPAKGGRPWFFAIGLFKVLI